MSGQILLTSSPNDICTNLLEYTYILLKKIYTDNFYKIKKIKIEK